MQEPLAGVRALEVAMYGFVTSAGAVLSDWGAEVLTVEHANRGYDGERTIALKTDGAVT
jgi:crotonobetainyl-CoA:carnitine CoA-transferase CaiB-like acyl-CoA transferase